MRGFKSELEENKKAFKDDSERTLLSIREAFEEQGVKSSQKFATTIADIEKEHEEKLKGRCDDLDAKFREESEELTKIAEVQIVHLASLNNSHDTYSAREVPSKGEGERARGADSHS